MFSLYFSAYVNMENIQFFGIDLDNCAKNQWTFWKNEIPCSLVDNPHSVYR